MSKKPNLFKILNNTVNTSPSRMRLFVPTLGSIEAIIFWLGLVVFLSLYGILVQFDQVTSLQHFSLLFFDFFLIQALVTFSIIGYTHLSIASYQSLSIFQQSKRIILTTLVLTPIATLLGKFIEMVLGFQALVSHNIFIEALVNTVLALILVPLLLYYFALQYAKILGSQQHYHKKLLHQNAQLKSRITPHFFFNMLNTLQYLSETDPTKSNELLKNIANLYRVSFYDAKEIGLNEEIDLCKQYLTIEQYRFGDKLKVHWALPDEEILYDISIPSLMLQMILEKLILAVVELATQTIMLTIEVIWVQDWVTLTVTTELPSHLLNSLSILPQDTLGAITPTSLAQTLDFGMQETVLQKFFGTTAIITTTLDTQTNTLIHKKLAPQTPTSLEAFLAMHNATDNPTIAGKYRIAKPASPQLITQIRYPLKDVAL